MASLNLCNQTVPQSYVGYYRWPGRLPPERELNMCDKCVDLDGKIEHYQRLARMIIDQPVLDGIKQLIAQLNAEKTALHPEQAK